MPLLVVPWPGRRHLPKRPCRVCCSGFLECLLCGAVPIPLYCLCLLARAMPLWNYYFSMLHRSPFPTLRGLRTAVVPMLRPSFHWLQWTSRGAWGTLPYHVGVVPVSTISMFLPVCASAPASSRRPRANPSSWSHFFHRMPAASYLCATCTHILAKCCVRREAPSSADRGQGPREKFAWCRPTLFANHVKG